MAEGTLRVGIVGVGNNAAVHVGTMIRAEGLDAVSICSPNDVHYQNTLDPLDAGAHVRFGNPGMIGRLCVSTGVGCCHEGRGGPSVDTG
jgi:predicted dehydrogenase